MVYLFKYKYFFSKILFFQSWIIHWLLYLLCDCERILIFWFFIELLWLIKELTKLCSIFYTFHWRLFIGVERGFDYLKFWCFDISYYCVKLNYKTRFIFIGKDQMDCEFMDHCIHRVYIRWYHKKALKLGHLKWKFSPH